MNNSIFHLSNKDFTVLPLPPACPHLNAALHPMRQVLASIRTCRNLLGLADEEISKSQELLVDMVFTRHDPGLDAADDERIEQISVKIRALYAELGELSEYCRAKAMMA